MIQVSSVAAPDCCPGHPEVGRHHGEGGAGWWCRLVCLKAKFQIPPLRRRIFVINITIVLFQEKLWCTFWLKHHVKRKTLKKSNGVPHSGYRHVKASFKGSQTLVLITCLTSLRGKSGGWGWDPSLCVSCSVHYWEFDQIYDINKRRTFSMMYSAFSLFTFLFL